MHVAGDRTILSRTGTLELPRSATAITATECVIYHLTVEDVNELKEFDSSIVETMALKAILMKCNTKLRKFLPYACWTDNQLDTLIRKRLKTVTDFDVIVLAPPSSRCFLLLSGLFTFFDQPTEVGRLRV